MLILEATKTPVMRLICSLLLCCLGLSALSQETSPYVKFGKVTVEELQKKAYALDSNANAIVLSDIGEAAIEGNSKGSFALSFTRHRVVHILNKNGYDEANVEIRLYTNGDDEEKLDNVKAVTYNLDNGKIVETKLEKSSIFKEKVNKGLVKRKFTMPNVKEGCIIEYEYKIISDYIENLDPWVFQGESPVLWSEFNLEVPEFFTYTFLGHGYHPMHINAPPKSRQVNFMVSDARSAGATERLNFTAGVTEYRWAMKDIPEIKLESFSSALRNHLSSIEFQLSSVNYPLTPKDFRSNWPSLIHQLLESEYFGAALDKNNNWLSDDLALPMLTAKTDQEKAQNIYKYVRDSYVCDDYSARSLSQPLKNIAKAKKGSVADINLILTAMFKHAGLKADPVLLSTTDHGYTQETYPMLSSYNYVVTRLVIGDQTYYLDASHPKLGFGKLMPDCYNGSARVINEEGASIAFSADSLKERKVTAVFISNDDKGNWIGSVNQTSGYYESYQIRNKIKDKGEEEFFKQVEKDFGFDITIEKPYVDSLKKYEDPVSLHYDIKLGTPKDDPFYINPLFGEAYKKNPFEAAERFYPVEMPYTMDETYLLTMQIPEGYVVDEIPKQVVAKFDEEESAYFEYRISQSGNTISLRSRVKFNRTLFLPDEYPTLREFFNLIVKKQAEQIVLKKKK
jgi:hypothetical protein